jgi:hypothetical protein
LEKTCFARYTFEYKWKINKTKSKYAIHQSVKQIICTKKKKAHPNANSRPSTGVDTVQVHLATDQRRAMARGFNQGAAAPPPPPLGPTFLRRYH